MIIYIDSEHKCHTSNDGTMRSVETDFFNGKCKEFIEGYIYDDSNGGEMVYPFKPYSILEQIQTAVDRTQDEADAELAALIEEIYNEDLEAIDNV